MSTSPKTVVITGASGVVGGRALAHLLAREDVGRVIALGRRALAIEHGKLASRVVDLQRAEAMAAETPGDVHAAICCLGTTLAQAGSKEAFRAVDLDAVVAFGEAARARGARRFVVVSSVGADARASSFYMRIKGEAEEALGRLGFGELVVVRPSLLDDEGARAESRLGERVALPLARALFAVVGRTNRYAPIRVDAVGKALARLALEGGEGPSVRVVQGAELHALGA